MNFSFLVLFVSLCSSNLVNGFSFGPLSMMRQGLGFVDDLAQTLNTVTSAAVDTVHRIVEKVEGATNLIDGLFGQDDKPPLANNQELETQNAKVGEPTEESKTAEKPVEKPAEKSIEKPVDEPAVAADDDQPDDDDGLPDETSPPGDVGSEDIVGDDIGETGVENSDAGSSETVADKSKKNRKRKNKTS